MKISRKSWKRRLDVIFIWVRIVLLHTNLVFRRGLCISNDFLRKCTPSTISSLSSLGVINPSLKSWNPYSFFLGKKIQIARNFRPHQLVNHGDCSILYFLCNEKRWTWKLWKMGFLLFEGNKIHEREMSSRSRGP